MANLTDFNPSSLITSNSPGKTSRSKVAPTISKALVSEATTYASPSLPIERGRIPWGSFTTYICA